MVATDGHRLSLAEKTGERIQGVGEETRVLIPRPALQDIHELLLDPSVETLLLVESSETFTFHVGQRTVSWVKPTEKFPDYETFMTRETQHPARFVVVPAGVLSAAIQRVTSSSFDLCRIRLRFEHSMLRITGPTAFIGEYEAAIPTSYTAETGLDGGLVTRDVDGVRESRDCTEREENKA
jgi:DNA polymerase III sliding clamp (beta) subunit (PCNA family)